MKAMIAAERMYFTADKSGLVAEGSPLAASLAAAYGTRIHPDIVAKFGIKDGKMAKPAENKMAKPAQNKSKGKSNG